MDLRIAFYFSRGLFWKRNWFEKLQNRTRKNRGYVLGCWLKTIAKSLSKRHTTWPKGQFGMGCGWRISFSGTPSGFQAKKNAKVLSKQLKNCQEVNFDEIIFQRKLWRFVWLWGEKLSEVARQTFHLPRMKLWYKTNLSKSCVVSSGFEQKPFGWVRHTYKSRRKRKLWEKYLLQLVLKSQVSRTVSLKKIDRVVKRALYLSRGGFSPFFSKIRNFL